jgi:tetratricopeptide (TPR) repeat protein
VKLVTLSATFCLSGFCGGIVRCTGAVRVAWPTAGVGPVAPARCGRADRTPHPRSPIRPWRRISSFGSSASKCARQSFWRAPDATNAAVLRARVHLAREQYAAARERLEQAIPGAPEAAWPRQVLSDVLLEEGRDWAAAEQVLRDGLALAPDYLSARHNLSELLRHRAGPRVAQSVRKE